MSETETGYSLGPWMIERFRADDEEDAVTAIVCYADEDGREGAILATINRWSYGDDPPKPESDANARLISAAPDMFEWISSVVRRDMERFTYEELKAVEDIGVKVGAI
jgi:hypothetical protein